MVSNEEAWEILLKPEKENLLENFGTDGLRRIKEYFLDQLHPNVDVDVNDKTIIEMFKVSTVNGTYS